MAFYTVIINNFFSSTLLFCIVITFTGCSGVHSSGFDSVTAKDNLPLWITKPMLLTTFQAVGTSKPNFQGMHIQRIEAITKARNILAKRISSEITFKYYSETVANSGSIKKQNKSDITEISKILLSDSYQADAYIDKKGNLYILMELRKTPQVNKIFGSYTESNNIITKLTTTEFNIEALLKRRCYTQSTLLNIKTKYQLHRGKPIWFYRPYLNNNKGNIGISEQTQTSSFASQKKVALSLAKLDLIKNEKLKINSYDKISTKILKNSMEFIEESHTKNSVLSIVKQSRVEDIWMDPIQCELYIYIVH